MGIVLSTVRLMYSEMEYNIWPKVLLKIHTIDFLNRKKQERSNSITTVLSLLLLSEEYLEAVVKPRQEAVLRKKEEDFYRMTGQGWKLSQGFTLGGLMTQEEQVTHTDADDETPNQRAARKRKELEVPNPVPVQTQLPKEKKIITLPDEPPEDANGVVKIALRFPSGRTARRRFLKTCRSTVLLDWLHKSGYSPTLYALYTSYPRSPLLTRTDLSVEDVGIVTHTALNVEEKDPSSS
ncbi:hypothetical protein QTP86_025210 [Hemibagrus guttatus]|nr:hypothetical protein QTP86_025210 [Hemibagrus guttatus]